MDPENVHADIEALVARAIDEGAATLAEVTTRVLPHMPESLHYAVAGRVADAVGRLARVHGEHERPWALVLSRLEVEEWTVEGREAR